MRSAWLAMAMLMGAGCFPCPQPQPLSRPDGGTIACVRPTDCPSEEGVLTCTQTQDRLYECLGCENNLCVRWVPGACR